MNFLWNLFDLKFLLTFLASNGFFVAW